MRDSADLHGTRRCACRSLLALLTLFAAMLSWTGLAAGKQIVINEVMYNPPGELDALQFIELFNPGDASVSLGGWSLAKGVKFTFPAAVAMPPKAHLVICRDRAAFTAHYGGAIAVLGNFTGRLKHGSERIELVDAQNQVVDTVKYSDSGDWPCGPDGYSSSLERICPWAESDQPGNWAASPLPPTERAAGTPGLQNGCFSTNFPPLIAKVEFSPKAPAPNQPVRVTAEVTDDDGVTQVTLLFRVASTGREGEERSVPMKRISETERGGVYEGTIDGQAQGQLIRFRVKASDATGTERLQPAIHEPRPAYSYFAFTNTTPSKIPVAALINVGQLTRGPRHYEPTPARRGKAADPTRGGGAFLYVPADGGEAQTFDFIRIARRHGGFKLHFHKDQPLKGMTGINLISEGPLRWILAEPLAYAVYRMAGVPSPLAEHVRLSADGRPLGFQLLVEQPNQAFLARNGRDASGNLYKLLWYGQGIVGQHEKKNNLQSGHTDLVQLIEGLRRKSGADQWKFIEQNFNVAECASYYAVNMCIQNWDGFFNNYYAFHDTAASGKWEIFPWDEDKTWGDYDGASARYDWYEMPLTFGMTGDSSPRDFRSRFGGGGPFGGVSWWRPPGYFSGPLLANREFRRIFLTRLEELCNNVFTEEQLFPIINAMEQRLEPELRLRSQGSSQDSRRSLREFAGYMQSFRNQVQNRRKFILNELKR